MKAVRRRAELETPIPGTQLLIRQRDSNDFRLEFVREIIDELGRALSRQSSELSIGKRGFYDKGGQRLPDYAPLGSVYEIRYPVFELSSPRS